MKNTHGGVLILVKLQASACSFTKINIPPWVFFTLFELYKWYQIVQRITYIDDHDDYDDDELSCIVEWQNIDDIACHDNGHQSTLLVFLGNLCRGSTALPPFSPIGKAFCKEKTFKDHILKKFNHDKFIESC